MMKTKYHLSIFLIALFAGLMGFTTDAAAKTRLTVKPNEVIFESGKSEKMVKISCNKKFRITTLEYPTWITLEGYNSNYGKVQQITLRAEKNTGPTRSGTVTIKTTEGDVKIKVRQYAAGCAIAVGGVDVDGDNATNITGPGITGQVSFDPATNTLTLNNATIQSSSTAIYDGNKDGILTIKLQGRNTIIGFSAINILHRPLRISGGGTLTIDAGNVSIYDAGSHRVSIENCTLNANRRMVIRGELQINNSNVYVIENGAGAYDVSGDFTLKGCQIVHPAGAQIKSVIGVSGRHTTVVDASNNVCTEVRISTGSTEPSEPEQPAKFTLDPKELEVEAKGGEHKVTITSTQTIGPMEFVGPDWIIRYSYPPGSRTSKVVDLTFKPNTGPERTGTITFKTSAGNVTLKVTQRAAGSTPSAKLTLDPEELTVEANRSYPKLKISCDEEFLFQGVSGLDWVSLNGNTPDYKKSHTFGLIVEENTGAERTGEITIKTTAGNVKLKVTQRAASSTPSAKLTLDPKALTMKYHRNEAEVTLACSDKAFSINQVVIDQLDWLSATGGSGLYKKHFIRITAQENPGAKRSGTVTFKTSEGEATLHVTQEAKSTAPPTLTLTPTTLTFPASGGASQSVAVKSSVEGWGVRLKDRTQDWLTVTPDAAAKQVTVAVKPNTGTKKRSAEVVVQSDAGLTSSFFVTQQGNRPPEAVSGLSLNPEAMTMGGSSGAVGFTLKSDKPWTVAVDADWLHPGSTHGNAGTTYFRLRFDQNTTGAVRTGKLTFTTTDGKATKTFTLTQRVGSAKPKPSTPSEGTYDYDLAVNPESITLSGEGGGSSIDVVTHRLWAGSTTDDWITLEKAVGRGNGSFDFTLAPNPSKEMRHGKITVRTEHGMDELTIAIHQQGQTGDIVLPGAVKVSGLTLDPATLVVDGDIASTLISALVSPENAANKSLLWMSSNPSVATVSVLGQTRSGVAYLPQLRFAPDADDYALVTIAGKGKATITAATSDGSGIVARCEIEVRSTVGNVVPYAPAAKIYATPGTLHLTLPQATRVEIYTLLGIRLRTLDAPAGDTSVTLPRGLYIVRAGTAVQKVRVE